MPERMNYRVLPLENGRGSEPAESDTSAKYRLGIVIGTMREPDGVTAKNAELVQKLQLPRQATAHPGEARRFSAGREESPVLDPIILGARPGATVSRARTTASQVTE